MFNPGFVNSYPVQGAQYAPQYAVQPYPQPQYTGQPIYLGGGGQPAPAGAPAYSSLSLDQRQMQSGLTEFERVSLRMWGHDIQDDGKNNGSVILKTLLNPEGSDNDVFLKDVGSVQTVFAHFKQDLSDDGVINGSSLRQTFGNVYWKVTGHDISQQLAAAPYQAANLSRSEVYRDQPDMTTADGLKEVSKRTGLSVNQFLNSALWGHDAVDALGPGGRNIDGSVLLPSLLDPKSIDYGFVNSSPGTKNYTQGLILGDLFTSGQINGSTLNRDFLNVVSQVYGRRIS